MFILKKLLLFLSVAVLITSLVFTALSWTLQKTAGDREQVKRWLEVSEFYNNIVDETIDTLEDNFEDKQNEYPLQAEVVSAIAKSILTSELIKSQIEPVIDNTYDWLSADKQALDFVIDLTEAKNAFIDRAVDETATRLSLLPACTELESRLILSEGRFSTIKLICIPEGVEIDEIKENIKADTDFSEFLPESVIKAEDIEIEDNGDKKQLQVVFEEAPEAYQNIKNIAMALTAVSLLLGVAVVFLSEPRRQGVKNLIKILVTGAIFVGFFAILIRILASGSLESFTESNSETVTKIIEPLIIEVMKSTSNWMFIFVGIYLALAAVALGYVLKTKPETAE